MNNSIAMPEDLKLYTPAGVEPTIWSSGGRDDHYDTPPG
jgi:hypothetical protein